VRIDEINIDGFGTLSDKTFDQFESPLTVIYGPNEAGKSTILSYVRQILFGFPTGRTPENKYLIESNLKHGGSLRVTMDDDRSLTIARHAGRTAAGTVVLHDDQNNLIDASELPRLLGGATRSVFESIFAFDLDELSTFNSANNEEIKSLLYGAGMSAPRMTETLREVDKVKNEIFLPGGQKQRVAQILRDLDDTESSLRTVQNQATEYRALKKEETETKVSAVKINDSISDGQSNRRLLNRRIEAWDTWINLGNNRERLAEIPIRTEFPEEAIPRLDTLEEKLANARSTVEDVTDRHHIAFDASTEEILHEPILERSRAVRKIVEQRGAFAASIRDLPERQAELKSDQTRIEEDLATLGPDWTQQRVTDFDLTIALRDQLEQFRSSRAEVDQVLRNRELEIERIKSEVSNAEQRSNEFKVESTSENDRSLNRAQLLLVSTAVIAGVILAATGLVINSTVFLGIGIGAGVSGLLFAGNLIRDRGSSPAGISHADRGRLLENRRFEDLLRLQLVSTEKLKISDIQKRQEECVSWHDWLSANDLPEVLSPLGASEFLNQIEIVKGRQSLATERQDRVSAIQDDINEYRELVSDVGKLVAISIDDDSISVQTASNEISELFDSVNLASQRRDAVKQSLPELDTELGADTRRLRQIETEFNQFLAEGKTEDTEEFRRLAIQHDLHRELEGLGRDLLDDLRHIVGPDYDLTELDNDLSGNSKDLMISELELLDSDLADIERDRNDLNKRLGELTVNIDSLVGDEQASKFRATKASLVSALKDQAVDWTRYSLAMALLDVTRHKYEKERQPAILERASGYFSEFTDGRYERVFSPLGEPEFHVVETDPYPQNKPASKLSRGTLEQLYLAMRFAAVEEFGEQREYLPIVVDEVLVNFDLNRAEKAARSFGEIAKNNQVIVFTCHPWMRDLFKNAVPGAGLIELDSRSR